MDLMDFGMRGQAQAVQTLIAMVPFLNARLQGLYKLGRRAAEDPRGLLRRGLVITAVTLAILADNWDDERYEELEEWKKDAYWHVFVGDEHVKIPKPFEVGLLFASVPERIVRAMTGKDETKQSADFLLRAVVDTLAFNPVPQLALPLVEQYANRDTFTGRPIENFSMELLPAEMRYRADTPLVARGLGALTGTSPVRIQHLVEGYLGGIGTYALQATDVLAYGLGLGAGERPTARIADWPVVRRFYDQQPQRTTRYVTEFYNLKKEVEQTVKGLKALQAEGDADAARDYAVNHRDKLALYRTVEHAAQALTRLHQQSLIVQRSPTMSGDAKRAALDRIAEQRNRLTQSVMQRAKATTTMIERLSRDDAARWRLIEAGG
jgi:hypothetical protein